MPNAFSRFLWQEVLGPETYKRIEKQNLFNVITRIRIYDFLKNQPYIFIPQKIEELASNVSGNQVCIIDTKNCGIPFDELRDRLAKYSFFLALPGASVPLSHNIVEAMSVGCVPILEKGYANLFHPPFIDGVTALIYDSYDSLNIKIQEAFEMYDQRLVDLKNNVSQFYSEHFSPRAAVSKMLDSTTTKIHLVSFSSSAKHIKKR